MERERLVYSSPPSVFEAASVAVSPVSFEADAEAPSAEAGSWVAGVGSVVAVSSLGFSADSGAAAGTAAECRSALIFWASSNLDLNSLASVNAGT